MPKGKFALGAVFGAAIGAIAGILMAPKSGKETRADLKVKAEQTKKDIQKTTKNVMKQADKVITDTKDKVQDIVDDTKDNVDELKRRSGNAVKGAKEGFAKEK